MKNKNKAKTKGIKLSINKKILLRCIIASSILLAVLLIFFSFYKIMSKSNFVSNLENKDILKTSSYYAEYNVTCVSNKNKNIYFFKEWYTKNECEKFKFAYLDFLGNEIECIKNNGKISISNLSQNSKYITNENNYGDFNLYSLATYISMINDSMNYNDSLKLPYRVEISNFKEHDYANAKDNIMTMYTILLDRENESDAVNNYTILNKRMKISKVEVCINEENACYIYVYNTEGKIYLSIEYTVFMYNKSIDESIFEI